MDEERGRKDIRALRGELDGSRPRGKIIELKQGKKRSSGL